MCHTQIACSHSRTRIVGFKNARNLLSHVADKFDKKNCTNSMLKSFTSIFCNNCLTSSLRNYYKNQIFITLVLVPVRWRSLLPQFATRHTVQSCIGGESMTSSANLIDSVFQSSLPRQKARTSGRSCIKICFWIWSCSKNYSFTVVAQSNIFLSPALTAERVYNRYGFWLVTHRIKFLPGKQLFSFTNQ